MLGFVRNILRGGFVAASTDDPACEALEAATPKSDTLPQELVVAIESALVTWRHFEGNEDTDEASYSSAVVRVIGLGGLWRFDGIAEAAERVQKHYPELTPQACRRAAKMIAAEIGKRNLEAHRQSSRRGRWSATDWGQGSW
ncbi:hypothetical protein Q4494_00150 [Celeribacter halophilus]|uniref:Uncharacterized protein n=1 Tax=Celeribacter halophilus TaxID=576117 RepID=A0AAW7XME2_9RHOB|nr:hypothetical protein [Celeribacter halophilus]MDO6455474.1 hypothetical protein [Celeribacter halophilus]